MCICMYMCTAVTLGEQVAEDNRINQKVLRMMLQANCAELTIVPDGQQAVDAYNKVLCIPCAHCCASFVYTEQS
jgi:hypothetical protein